MINGNVRVFALDGRGELIAPISGIARSVTISSKRPEAKHSSPSRRCCGLDRVALRLQLGHDRRADQRVVVDHEDVHGRAGSSDSVLPGRGGLASSRQPYGERRALSRHAVDRQEPWWRSTVACTSESPRPVPCLPLVEKKGSRQRRRTSSLMPVPVSLTSRRTCPLSGRARTVIVAALGHGVDGVKMRLRASRGWPARRRDQGTSPRHACSR